MSVDQAVVEVQSRNTRGKGEARRLRQTGLIPGVVYGAGKEPTALAINPDALRRALKTAHGLNTVLTLKFDGGKSSRLALLKDWEKEVTSSRLVHADFVEISLDKPVRVEVPVHVTGKAKGTLEGGILEIIRHVLVVDAMPANIPTEIMVDVTELGLGSSIHLNEIKMPEGVKPVAAQNWAVVAVNAVRQEKEPEAVVAAGAEGAAAPAADGKAAAPAAGKDAKGAAPADAKAAKAAPAKK
jgi:large subunit ribosomal protein L25